MRGSEQLEKRRELGFFGRCFVGSDEEFLEESGTWGRSILGHASFLP